MNFKMLWETMQCKSEFRTTIRSIYNFLESYFNNTNITIKIGITMKTIDNIKLITLAEYIKSNAGEYTIIKWYETKNGAIRLACLYKIAKPKIIINLFIEPKILHVVDDDHSKISDDILSKKIKLIAKDGCFEDELVWCPNLVSLRTKLAPRIDVDPKKVYYLMQCENKLN